MWCGLVVYLTDNKTTPGCSTLFNSVQLWIVATICIANHTKIPDTSGYFSMSYLDNHCLFLTDITNIKSTTNYIVCNFLIIQIYIGFNSGKYMDKKPSYRNPVTIWNAQDFPGPCWIFIQIILYSRWVSRRRNKH